MSPHDRLEGCPLKPPNKQLGIVYVVADISKSVRGINQGRVHGAICRWERRREETGDISIPVGHARGSEVQTGRDGALQHVPCREDVARPEDCSIALRPQIGRASKSHHPAVVSKVASGSFVHRSCVEERINVVIAWTGSDIEHVLHWIDIGFRFVEPQIIETVRLDVSVPDGLPPPLGRVGVGSVNVRANYIFEPTKIRLTIRGMD